MMRTMPASPGLRRQNLFDVALARAGGAALSEGELRGPALRAALLDGEVGATPRNPSKKKLPFEIK